MGCDSDFDFTLKEENKILIEVNEKTNFLELLNSYEDLINKDDKKYLNLIAIGDSIEILEIIIKKIKKKILNYIYLRNYIMII